MLQPTTYQLLGVQVHAMLVDELYATVQQAIQEGKRCVIGNHNLHSVYLYHHHTAMRRFCDCADYVFIDGMPLIYLGRLLGFPLRREHRLTAVEWARPFMRHAAEHGWRVFLLGSRPGIAERAAEALRRVTPALQVATAHGYFDANPGSPESEAVLDSIRHFQPHVLIVGMGMPRQEWWISENHDRIEANAILNQGAVLDYLAGTVPTPPRWLARIGFEWLGRLACEPRRLWRRYLVEPWFLLPLVRQVLAERSRRLLAGATHILAPTRWRALGLRTRYESAPPPDRSPSLRARGAGRSGRRTRPWRRVHRPLFDRGLRPRALRKRSARGADTERGAATRAGSTAPHVPPRCGRVRIRVAPRMGIETAPVDRCPPLRVAHVLTYLSAGGAARSVTSLIARQTAYQVKLFVVGQEPGIQPAFDIPADVIFLRYSRNRRDVGGALRCIRDLRRALREFQPDIVHAHLWAAALFSALALPGPSARHVVHVRDCRAWLASPRWHCALGRQLSRLLLKRVRSRFIAVSEAAKEYTALHLRIPRHHIEVIYNGIDAAVFRPKAATRPPRRRVVIGTAGRLGYEKGHDHLLQTAAQLRDRSVNCEIRIAGNASDASRCRYVTMADELGVNDRVVFLGQVQDMRQFYSELDIFAFPSLTEGLGVAVLEAMAMELPVVATAVGGVPEIINSPQVGILVPPADPAAMTAAIMELIGNPARGVELARQGRQRVLSCFSQQSTAERIAATYGRLVERGGDGGA